MKKLSMLFVLLAAMTVEAQAVKVGVFEQFGGQWTKNSGVKWDYRYSYLTYQWSFNWASTKLPRDGAYVARFFNETASYGLTPAIAYYETFDLPPSGTGTYAKLKLVNSQKEYFNDFKILMQQAKTFGKPVLVLVEPDTTGYLQGELKGLGLTPDLAYAAIKDTGIPELANTPNTVSGWGKAFLAIRDGVGATNVKLGIHVSGWATGTDILYQTSVFSWNQSIQDAVNQTSAFLTRLGMDQYDVLVTDPLDRDADYYKLVRSENRWFNVDDSATVDSQSFNRYATWLDVWHAKAQKSWVMWQIPVGNSNSPNNCTSGYKSPHSEYFFNSINGAAHIAKFQAAGVTTMLFGKGADCQATQETDGNYLRDGVKTYLTAPVTPVVDAGVPTTPADAGTVNPPVTAVQYDFESNAQGWTIQGNKNVLARAISDATHALTGSASLGLDLGGTAGTQQVLVANPSIPAGSTVSFSFYFKIGDLTDLTSVQFFAQESSATQWRWNAVWKDITTLKPDQWNTVTVAIPVNASAIQSLGIEITTKGSTPLGTVYLDTVKWGSGAVVSPDAGTSVDAGVPTKPDSGVIADAGTTPAQDAGTVNPPIGNTVVIHTIGDSTTESVNSSWRCGMVAPLKAAGISVQFVGTLTHPYSSCVEGKNHNGMAGYTAESVAAQAPAWIKALQPDIVIWNAGINTGLWYSNETGTVAGARHEKFINDMFAAKPNIKIIVWTIVLPSKRSIPPLSQDSDVWFTQYNDQIRTIIAKLKAQGKPIVLVDMPLYVKTSELYDGVHEPESAGKNEMAPEFAKAVLSFK